MTHHKTQTLAKRVLALATSLLLVPTLAFAVPTTVTQQGRLVDASGDGLTGSHTIAFSLFSDSAGTTSVWSEQHTVEVEDGYYAVVLGADSSNLLDDTVLSLAPLYLGMTVDGGSLMQPLLEVTSAPYAIMAGTSQYLDGGYADASSLYIEGDLVIDGNGDWVGNALPGSLTSLGCVDGEEARYSAANGWECIDPGSHYTGAQAISAMGAESNSNPLNHARYTDTDAVAAVGPHLTTADAVAAVGPHFTGADAVTAMGAADNSNSLNHARYTDTDAVAAVGPHLTTADAVAAVTAADSYVSNTGDTMSGSLTVTGTVTATNSYSRRAAGWAEYFTSSDTGGQTLNQNDQVLDLVTQDDDWGVIDIGTNKMKANRAGWWFVQADFTISGGDGSGDSIFVGWSIANSTTLQNKMHVDPDTWTRAGEQQMYSINGLFDLANNQTVHPTFQGISDSYLIQAYVLRAFYVGEPCNLPGGC